jgi:hypothetical protein
VADADRLGRRYRRLLWAYPNWYRHERGEEVLSTLLDAARPGQRRPGVAEVLDLVSGGIRCRLRLPRDPGYRIVAVIVASFAALVGAAAASGFAVIVPPPTEERAAALAETAMAQRPHNLPGPTYRCPDYCNYQWVRHGDQVVVFDDPFYRNLGVDHTTVVYWAAGPDAVAAARGRLIADGWSIDDRAYPPGALSSGPFGPPIRGFTAYRGNLSLHLHQTAGSGLPPVQLTFEPRRAPAALDAAAAAGGMVAGWMAFCWVIQRGRRHTTGVKAVIVLLGVPLLLLISLVEILLLPLLVLFSVNGSVSAALLLLPAAGMHLLSAPVPGLWIPAATAILSVLAVAAAALPTRGHPRSHPELAA